MTSAASPDRIAGADTVLCGKAGDVLLTCWRRRPLNVLQVRGDLVLAQAFHASLRF